MASVFNFLAPTYAAAGTVQLHYAVAGYSFTETIDFGAPLPRVGTQPRAILERLVYALSVVAGISYYKAFVSEAFAFAGGMPLPTSAQAGFFQTLYLHGLGEFAARNGQDLTAFARFPVGEELAPAPVAHTFTRRSAVLLGGGKDSLVSLNILQAAQEPLMLFAVNAKGPILACAEVSGAGLLGVTRTLDAQLFALNNQGALNGHVPITAIVSLIALCGACVFGFDAVITSNERSADEGNVLYGGIEVNHQYSKTLGFERALQGYVQAFVTPDLDYFSLLRPLSELHIAKLLSATTRYDAAFSSCNQAFKILPQINNPLQGKRWCGDCPKCRFTSLMLAAHNPPARVARIVGADLLNDPNQLEGFAELMGLSGHKPWECVGELAESAAALLHIAGQAAWQNHAVVAALAPRLRAKGLAENILWQQLLTPSTNHAMPVRYLAILTAATHAGQP